MRASENALSLEVHNCTFVGNRAASGRAIWLGSVNPCEISNSILWNGGDEVYVWSYPSPMEITYSTVQNGWPGVGNLAADPCFVDLGHWDPNGTPDDAHDDIWVNGDYHLKSQAGHWDAACGQWILDGVTSHCIDAGDPTALLGAESFPNGGRINMGAYGGTAEASLSFFGGPLCQTIMAGDINGDCRVDMADFALMAANWMAAIGFQATEPFPPDGATGVESWTLTWTPGHGALSHDVYFGSNLESVRDAGRDSPTYKGNVRYPFYRWWPNYGGGWGGEYYWRIDEVNHTTTTRGTVWQFWCDFGHR